MRLGSSDRNTQTSPCHSSTARESPDTSDPLESGTQLELDWQKREKLCLHRDCSWQPEPGKANRLQCPCHGFVALGSRPLRHSKAGRRQRHWTLSWDNCPQQTKRHFCSTAPPSHRTPCKSRVLSWAEGNVETTAAIVYSGRFQMQSCSRSLSDHPQTSPMLLTATETSPPCPSPLPERDNQQREKFLPVCSHCRDPKKQQRSKSGQPYLCALCYGREPTVGCCQHTRAFLSNWTGSCRCNSGRNSWRPLVRNSQ